MRKLRKLQTSPRVRVNIVFFSIILCLSLFAISCAKKNNPLDLGFFTRISDLSISPDGNQILFNGCGHKDYPACTIYRFDRSADKLYRYIITPSSSTLIRDGRYAASSSKFAFLVVPLNEERKQQLNDIQIAYVNQDGTGFHQITHGEGTKVAPMLSYNEKILVYFKGRKRDSGKTAVSDYDLYKTNILTGQETQLTKFSFYDVSDPYFMPDDKSVVFGGDSPLRLTDGSRTEQFRAEYKKKYGDNIILQYPLDGSGVDKEPVPIINFGTGSRWPMVTKDGSIWFEGLTGEQHFIGHYHRFPDGRTLKLHNSLDGGRERNRFRMTITTDGSLILVLYEGRGKSRERSIAVFNTASGVLSDLVIPATAENIKIQ
jgi:Tol biopolymer transport system component